MNKVVWIVLGLIGLILVAVGSVVVLAVRPIWAGGDAMRRGIAYNKQGDYQHAYAEFDRAVTLLPHQYKAYAARGDMALRLHRPAETVNDATRALELIGANPDKSKVTAFLYAMRGQAYANLAQYPKALTDLESSYRIVPIAKPANDLAWLLATCPDATIRDGKRAVKLALSACEETGWQRPGVIDTLAAAYAEAGDFENAVKYQQKAIALADPEDQVRYKSRLALYQQRQPYREVPGQE